MKNAFCVRKRNLISMPFARYGVQQHSWTRRKCPRGYFYQQIKTRPSSNGKRRVQRVRLSFKKRPVEEFHVYIGEPEIFRRQIEKVQ